MKPWQRRLLGILSLGGGFLGAVLILTQLLWGAPSSWQVLVSLPFLALYLWGIWCGVLMLEGQPRALAHNRWFWAIQVPVLLSPAFSYQFMAGGGLNLGFNFTGLRLFWEAQLGSKFRIDINRGSEFGLGLNLLALAITVFVWRLARRVQRMTNDE